MNDSLKIPWSDFIFGDFSPGLRRKEGIGSLVVPMGSGLSGRKEIRQFWDRRKCY